MKNKKSFKNYESISWGSSLKRTSVIMVLLTAVIISMSAYYLHFSWHRYQNSLASEAIMLAQSIESMLHPEHVLQLSGDSSDLAKSEYLMIKENLSHLAEGAEPVWFAYIMAKRGDDIIFLVDSESSDSPDHSPPGQIYEEAADVYRMPFLTGETVLTEPSTDRWGTWISALVPVKDPADGKVIAVLGIDYSASLWNLRIWKRMIPDFMIVVCIILLYLAFISIWAQHSKLKYFSKRLAYDEALYHSVFDQTPIGIAIVNDKSFAVDSEFGDVNINAMFETILDRDHQSISKLKWPEITHPDDLSEDLSKFERFKAGETDGYTMEKRFIKPDGSSVWTSMKISSLNGGSYEDSLHLCLLEDISRRKSMEESLEESERSKTVLLSHLPGMAYRCEYELGSCEEDNQSYSDYERFVFADVFAGSFQKKSGIERKGDFCQSS